MKIAHVMMQIGHCGICVITLSKQGRLVASIKWLFLKGHSNSAILSYLAI